MDRKPIQKVVRKVALEEQTTDFAYWQEQSYEARLAALEEIRREYHQWQYDTQPRLQRFLQIVKRA